MPEGSWRQMPFFQWCSYGTGDNLGSIQLFQWLHIFSVTSWTVMIFTVVAAFYLKYEHRTHARCMTKGFFGLLLRVNMRGCFQEVVFKFES
jgi:hypothetical protein